MGYDGQNTYGMAMIKTQRDYPNHDWSHPLYQLPGMVAMQLNSLAILDRERQSEEYRDMIYARRLWNESEARGLR